VGSFARGSNGSSQMMDQPPPPPMTVCICSAVRSSSPTVRTSIRASNETVEHTHFPSAQRAVGISLTNLRKKFLRCKKNFRCPQKILCHHWRRAPTGNGFPSTWPIERLSIRARTGTISAGELGASIEPGFNCPPKNTSGTHRS